MILTVAAPAWAGVEHRRVPAVVLPGGWGGEAGPDAYTLPAPAYAVAEHRPRPAAAQPLARPTLAAGTDLAAQDVRFFEPDAYDPAGDGTWRAMLAHAGGRVPGAPLTAEHEVVPLPPAAWGGLAMLGGLGVMHVRGRLRRRGGH